MKQKKTLLFLMVLVVKMGILDTIWAKSSMPSLDRLHQKVDHALTNAHKVTKHDFQNYFQTSSQNIQAPDQSLTAIFNQLATLHWSSNCVFVEDFGKTGVLFLQETLPVLFPGDKAPLITFLHQLKEEDEALVRITTDVFRLMQKKFIDNDDGKLTMQKAFDKIQLLKKNLESLIGSLNDVLLYGRVS